MVDLTDIHRQTITGPAAWKAADMRARTDWIDVLTAAEIADLDRALRAAQARGLAMADVTRDDFRLPVLEPYLAELEKAVRTGRGFALLRGIPVGRYSDEEVFLIKWGIGTHLGAAVSPKVYGDLLGHVYDHKRDPG